VPTEFIVSISIEFVRALEAILTRRRLSDHKGYCNLLSRRKNIEEICKRAVSNRGII